MDERRLWRRLRDKWPIGPLGAATGTGEPLGAEHVAQWARLPTDARIHARARLAKRAKSLGALAAGIIIFIIMVSWFSAKLVQASRRPEQSELEKPSGRRKSACFWLCLTLACWLCSSNEVAYAWNWS